MIASYIFMILAWIVVLAFAIWAKNSFPKLKGKYGEKMVKKSLEQLDSKEYIIFHDLYVPTKKGTSQIDHVIVYHKGIFVLETKNYTGWIFGNENGQHWTQVIYKRKVKFYNPIRQNFGHIQALKDYLGENTIQNIPFFSIIVFSNEATLRFKELFKKSIVIQRKQLVKTIKSYTEHPNLTTAQTKIIIKKLSLLQAKDRKHEKHRAKQHIIQVKEKLIHDKQKAVENICPRCGNTLVIRNGKNGSFKGCSSFPKCRYTA